MGVERVQGGGGADGGSLTTDTDGEEAGEKSQAPELGVESELTDTEIFDILRNSRRRDVITYLLEGGERAKVAELTEHVASREYDVVPEEVSSDQHKRVYTALYQCHLPRLEQYGVIDFHKEDKAVELRDTVAQFEQYLYGDDDSSTVGAELVAAVGIAVLVTLGVLGAGPLGAISAGSWAILTAFALVGFGLFQFYRAELRRP